MKRRKAERLVRNFLQDLGSASWGRYDISRPDNKEASIKWFLDTCEKVGIIRPDDPSGG